MLSELPVRLNLRSPLQGGTACRSRNRRKKTRSHPPRQLDSPCRGASRSARRQFPRPPGFDAPSPVLWLPLEGKLRAAVMRCYPAGLPPPHPPRCAHRGTFSSRRRLFPALAANASRPSRRRLFAAQSLRRGAACCSRERGFPALPDLMRQPRSYGFPLSKR